MRALLFLFSFLVLVALQVSFLPRFPVAGFIPNILFLFVFLAAFVERPQSSLTLWGALLAGFLWDAYSSHFLGQGVSILVALVLLVKIAKAYYVRFPAF
ncbi:rod shape-determining protein MreD [Patescibacteria group bacterium]|nr:rod shape-determining protein MreD [Patescibacteria group bacterium]